MGSGEVSIYSIVKYLYSNFAKFCLSYQMRDLTLKRKEKELFPAMR